MCISDRMVWKGCFDKVMSEQRPKCTERDSLVNISGMHSRAGTGAGPGRVCLVCSRLLGSWHVQRWDEQKMGGRGREVRCGCGVIMEGLACHRIFGFYSE